MSGSLSGPFLVLSYSGFPSKQSKKKIRIWCLNTIPGEQKQGRERECVRERGKVNSRRCLAKLLIDFQNITVIWLHRGVLWLLHLIISCQGEEVYEFNFSIPIVSFLSLTKFTSSCIIFPSLLCWVIRSFCADSGENEGLCVLRIFMFLDPGVGSAWALTKVGTKKAEPKPSLSRGGG